MARDYAKIHSIIWRSRKFRSLKDNDQAKLIYFYLHSCPQVNSVGCFSIPLGYIEVDLGWSKDTVREALNKLCEVDLISWNETEELVRIHAFIEHDPPTNPKHAHAMFSATRSIPSGEFREAVLSDLSEQRHAAEIPEIKNRVFIGYKKDSCPVPVPVPTPVPDPVPNQPISSSLRSDEDIPKSSCKSNYANSQTLPDIYLSQDDVTMAQKLYNDVAEEFNWTKWTRMSPQRTKALKARLKECGGIEGWRAAMERVRASPFLTGKIPRAKGHETWEPNGDFFLQQKSFIRLLEGFYDARIDKTPPTGSDAMLAGAMAAINGYP